MLNFGSAKDEMEMVRRANVSRANATATQTSADQLGPQMANQLGWFTAEVGRQPWIVYGLMRTADAGSPSVTSGQILASLGLFLLIYLALFILFIYLLDQKIRHGPLADDLDVAYHQR